jgi:signal transduction histidine kinase/ActR/RegA family two-component response regulator
MYPDTPTVVLFGAILLSFVGILQIWIWHRDRTLGELGLWGTAHLLAGLGVAMLSARGIVPPRLSINSASALVALGGGIAWMGVRRFERRPAWISVGLAGAIIWLVVCQFRDFYTSMPDRVAGGATILAAYDVLCAHEFLRRRDGGDLPSRRALAIVFGIDAAMHISRLLIAVSLGFDQPLLSLPPSQWFGWPAMLGIACVLGTSVLQIAVAKEAAEQRSNAILARARDTADLANLAKSRFLARMSHELRTPLNGVLGMAQTLTRDKLLRGVQRERAVMMERSGRHLLAIINDILDLASVESGQFQLSPEPALVSDIVQGGLDLVAETAAGSSMTLNLTQDADVPAAVLADPLRVRQILVNLLGNAIKFTPPGGRVTLHVARLAPAGGVRLTVTDTGPGVDPQFQPHLFEDFVRRPLGTGGAEGTGLGLSISASLAEAMGGTIHYQPGPHGMGSRFIVELPLPLAEPPARLPVSLPAARAASGQLVLVIDDVASNRRLAEALLEQAGYAVLLAADGPAAVAALQSNTLPDVVLMDLHMPGMDGLETARRIRSLPGRAGLVPILAVTADASADHAPAILDAGMNGMVSKPIDIDELVSAIAAVVPPALATITDAGMALQAAEPAASNLVPTAIYPT